MEEVGPLALVVSNLEGNFIPGSITAEMPGNLTVALTTSEGRKRKNPALERLPEEDDGLGNLGELKEYLPEEEEEWQIKSWEAAKLKMKEATLKNYEEISRLYVLFWHQRGVTRASVTENGSVVFIIMNRARSFDGLTKYIKALNAKMSSYRMANPGMTFSNLRFNVRIKEILNRAEQRKRDSRASIDREAAAAAADDRERLGEKENPLLPVFKKPKLWGEEKKTFSADKKALKKSFMGKVFLPTKVEDESSIAKMLKEIQRGLGALTQKVDSRIDWLEKRMIDMHDVVRSLQQQQHAHQGESSLATEELSEKDSEEEEEEDEEGKDAREEGGLKNFLGKDSSVVDVWNEWINGVDGNPPLKLRDHVDPGWRGKCGVSPKKIARFFYNKKVVCEAIELIGLHNEVVPKLTCDNVATLLEHWRQQRKSATVRLVRDFILARKKELPKETIDDDESVHIQGFVRRTLAHLMTP